jgi:hypothetical protein
LFDTNKDPEKEDSKMQDPAPALPEIPNPKLLQAPHKIPTLFPYSRTSVYLLMSPETIQQNPTSVVLRARSIHGPLALEIPVEVLSTPAETIHQLAAKKAMQDLEEERGWIVNAQDQAGVLVKDRYPSKFEELVTQEAVRLGETFQVAGKWCSSVAVSAMEDGSSEDSAGAESCSIYSGQSVFSGMDSGGLQCLTKELPRVSPTVPKRILCSRSPLLAVQQHGEKRSLPVRHDVAMRRKCRIVVPNVAALTNRPAFCMRIPNSQYSQLPKPSHCGIVDNVDKSPAAVSDPNWARRWENTTDAEKVLGLIALQDFEGSWQEDNKAFLPFLVVRCPRCRWGSQRTGLDDFAGGSVLGTQDGR